LPRSYRHHLGLNSSWQERITRAPPAAFLTSRAAFFGLTGHFLPRRTPRA